MIASARDVFLGSLRASEQRMSGLGLAGPARVYRLAAEAWEAGDPGHAGWRHVAFLSNPEGEYATLPAAVRQQVAEEVAALEAGRRAAVEAERDRMARIAIVADPPEDCGGDGYEIHMRLPPESPPSEWDLRLYPTGRPFECGPRRRRSNLSVPDDRDNWRA